MTQFISNILPFMIFIIIMSLASHRNHFLMILLFLETATLILTLALLVTIKSPFIILIMLTFGACEATLGLSCLVKMTHSFGSDKIKVMSLSKC